MRETVELGKALKQLENGWKCAPRPLQGKVAKTHPYCESGFRIALQFSKSSMYRCGYKSVFSPL
jgi:hypothetical protein